MKKLVLLTLFLGFASSAMATSPADQISSIVQSELNKHQKLKLAVVIGAVQPGNKGTILKNIFYFGNVVDQNGSPLTLNGKTEFEIGSVTKTFTATIFASMLKEEPDLFDTSTNDFFSQTPTWMGQNATLGELSNYTSGLPDSNRGTGTGSCDFNGGTITDCYDIQDLLTNLSDTSLSALKFAPGTEYLYSDLGYGLLAFSESMIAINQPELFGLGDLFKDSDPNDNNALLEAWEKLLSSVVLGPLAMKSTHPFNPATDPPLLPRGYHRDTAGKISKALNHNTSWPAFLGAGGIVSTPDDMLLYLEYNLDLLHNNLNSLLPIVQKPSTTVLTGGGDQIGIGWFIGTLELGGKSIPFFSKNGGVPAFSTQIDFAPSTHTGVVVLTNSASDKDAKKIVDVEKIAYQALQIINGSSSSTPPHTGDEP